MVELLVPVQGEQRGAEIAQWLERWIERLWVWIPAEAAGEFSSPGPGSTFCADSYFGTRSTPRVITVAHKRSRSFCQKCRWQVTAKHTCTLRMWLCMKWYGAWLYGVHRTCQNSSNFMWHQPYQHCKYTTSVDSKMCQKMLFNMWNHNWVQWVCLRAENSAV